MEIPVINRLTEFEATINSLNNPSLISRFVSTIELDFLNFSLPFQFCKWGALFLALLYAFTSFAYRIKIFILQLRNKSKSLLSSASAPLLSQFDDDDVSSSDDENDDVSSSSDYDYDEDEMPHSSYEDLTRFDDDFRVKGSFGNFCNNLRRCRSIGDNISLSSLVSGSGIVRLWESSIPSVSIAPTVVFTAAEDGKFGFDLWDFRVNQESPVVQADWQSDRRAKVIGVDADRAGKVYVRDKVGMAIGDIRKVDVPLEKLTAFEEDAWWDAVTRMAESKNEFARR